MAADANFLESLLEEFMCPICREYFKDPMITSCGHNFCHTCISHYWESFQDSFPCPVCRAESPEIKLRPNRQLRNVQGPIKNLVPWARARRAGDRPCEKHGRARELFCTEDHMPICILCRESGAHGSHHVISLQVAWQEFQEKCEAHLKTLREEREKQLGWKATGEEKSQEYLKQTQVKRQKIVVEFQQQHHFLQEQERLLLAQLQKLEEELEKHQTERGRKLSEQISHLSELIGELEGTCQKPASEFLQDIRSTLSRCEEEQAQQPEAMAPELEEQVRDFSQQTTVFFKSLRAFRVTLPAALAAQRAHSPANVTLDPDTAHPQLVLSEDGKRVRWERTRQPRPDTPERFDYWECVLGCGGFTSGRHYWELGVGDGQYWAVGVARQSVSRKGWINLSPEGGIWVVGRWGDQIQAFTDPETPLPLNPPSRIRVCLDCDRGQVTFIDAGSEAPIFTFPPGSLPGERIRPWILVWDTDTELQLSP